MTGLGVPSSPGQTEIFTAQPLDVGVHYFALKARLTNGEYSLLSNCVCTYVSDQNGIVGGDPGGYVSFTGIVSGRGADGAIYCQDQTGLRAIRAMPLSGQSATSGQEVTCTGIISSNSDFVGTVLDQTSVTQLATQQTPKIFAMLNRSIYGGSSDAGPTSPWMLIRTCGRVSGLTTGSGCSFYINDGSVDGNGVYVVSSFSPPAELINGAFVTVEGIARVSTTSGRQIEVVKADGVRIY